MADVSMPRLSDSMEEGTILKWLKSDGDEVSKGEELVEIETDKANMTYEADADGVLEIVAQEGDTLAVGETIAHLGAGGGEESSGEDAPGDAQAGGEEEGDEGEEAEDEHEDNEAEDEGESDEAEAESDGESENGHREEAPEPAPARAESADADGNGDGGNGRVKASPVARRMAREMGV